MTERARTIVYMDEARERRAAAEAPPRKAKPRAKGERTRLSPEDVEIVLTLNKLKSELSALHNRYDQTTDPLLIDSLIYETKAVNMKYMFYLGLCKEKGIVSGG